jgi:nucleotide-binding universal stress UspA family protein
MIVVGVDGSGGARDALRLALEEARFRRAAVRVVAAWHVPVAAYGGAFVPPDPALVAEPDPDARRAAVAASAACCSAPSASSAPTTRRARS